MPGLLRSLPKLAYEVRLFDVDRGSLDRGLAAIQRSVARLVDKGVVSEHVDAVTSRVIPTTSMSDFSTAFIGVEAVFERLDIKQDVFRSLDQALPPEAILATNTSALPITKLAQVTSRPDRVVGTHFFSPVPMMQLCELVRGEQTSDQTLAQSRAFAENVGKTCVVVNRDIAGFVTTRLITALVVEASRLVEGGVASVEDVDVACRLGFGHAMGPLETMDLIGIDVMVDAADNIAAETPGTTFAVPALLRQMVEQGRLGRKTERGFYDY